MYVRVCTCVRGCRCYLKFLEAVTGVKSVPFDDVRALEGVTIYGLPDGVSLQRPRSYTPEQLHAIVKELGKVVFLPAGSKNASSQ